LKSEKIPPRQFWSILQLPPYKPKIGKKEATIKSWLINK